MDREEIGYEYIQCKLPEDCKIVRILAREKESTKTIIPNKIRIIPKKPRSKRS